MAKPILQIIPVKLTAIVVANVLAPAGADTQKIFNDLLPAFMERVRAIPWVARVDACGVEEIVPDMKSKMDC